MAKLEVKGEAQLRKVLAEMSSPAVAAAMVTGPMVAGAGRIMAESLRLVPRRDGVLAGSGTVLPPKFDGKTVTIEIGYGGAASGYAMSVHENPRSGKTGGVSPRGVRYKKWAAVGQWKYLEQPVKSARGWYWQEVARMTAAKMRGLR